MSLLDGAPKSPLPSMSWDSVVDGAPTTPPADPSIAPSENEAPSSDVVIPPAPTITIAAESISTGSTSSPAPAASMLQEATPAAAATPDAGFAPGGSLFSAVNLAVPAPPAPPAAPVPPPPAAPPARPTEPEPAVDAAEELTIVEATPIPELTSDEQAAVDASNTNEIPVTDAAPETATPAPSAPSQPSAQSNALHLPSHQAAPPMPAANAGFNPLAVDMTAPTPSKRRRQRKSGSGVGLIFVLLLLCGLVAAGIVFGKPYLFPDEWDASAKSYAENIEEIRGVEFVEPLTVISESSDAYRQRVGDQLLGDWETKMPMWRALGLAAGGTERDVLDSLIAERSPAIYSNLDGQVYHDATLPAIDLDAQVTLAMATAALDQEFLFAPRSDSRTLLAEAMTQAHVLQQATLIQQQSDAPTAIRPTDDAPLAFLPPVLDYELVAPAVFADLLPEFDDVAANPLGNIGSAGPGPLNSAELADTVAAATLPEESVVGMPQQMGRGFWYLSFASHLDASEAWRMSTMLSASSLTEVSAGATTCFYSLFETSTVDGVSTVANGLSSWVSAVAPELQASVSTLDESTVQLRTCDPGDVFSSNARFGVARDLIAWQATELATITAVIADGGDQAAIDQAINRLAVSDATSEVLALDPTVSATEVVAAAQDAVIDIVATPAPADAEALPNN